MARSGILTALAPAVQARRGDSTTDDGRRKRRKRRRRNGGRSRTRTS